ncbi:MAG: hypothetical protein KatS3mg029_0286 [Saprospiraceae bacterium]|nr:MAG: hypothetical protein KatS3mg029_0286 [Saprospiraceae bacterium]
MLRSTFLAWFILFGFFASAQEFRGLVVNERTGEPIAFAGFTTEAGYPLSVSNRQGEFRLCADDLQKIQVSAPGFEEQSLDPSAWPEGQRQVIALKEAEAYDVTDFEKRTGRELMHRVFEKAADTYQMDALALKGFFREMYWLPESGQLLMRQEASVTTALPKLKKLPASQRAMSAIYAGSKEADPEIELGKSAIERGFEFRNDSLIALVQGPDGGAPGLPLGTYLCADQDVIRNPIYFFGQHDLTNYVFEWEQTVSYFGEPVAVVRFSPMEASAGAWFEGTLYVDLLSHAIIRAHYRNTSYAVEEFNHAAALPSKVMLSRDYDVGYTRWQGKWYLQFASATTDALELKNVQTVRTYSDFVVHGIEVKGRKTPDLPKEGKLERVQIAEGPFPWGCSNYPPHESLKAEKVDTFSFESDLVIHYPQSIHLDPTLMVPKKHFEEKPYYFKLTMSPLTSPVYVDAPEEPVIAMLMAGNQQIPVYMERGQRTVITITADQKRNPSFNIYERDGHNNTTLVSFERLKSRLLVSLRNAWKTGGPDEFFKMTRILQGSLRDFLRREQESHSLSPLMVKWLQTRATYLPAAWLIAYQLQTNPYAPLPAEWQEWLSGIEMNNQQAAFHPDYQQFVLLKLKHEALQREYAEGNMYPIQAQLDLANELLSDTALENVALLLLQNSLRCATPELELDISKLREVLKDSSAAARIYKVQSIFRSYPLLAGIPLQDVATGNVVKAFDGAHYLTPNTLLVFVDCKCGGCKECGLMKKVVKPSKYYPSYNLVIVVPLWFDELCEANFDDCKLSKEEHTILSVKFEHLPEFVAQMPFVEIPQMVLLGSRGVVKEISHGLD